MPSRPDVLILDRYLIREVARPLLAVFVILLIVFAGISAADFLAGAATGILKADTVAALVLLKTIIAMEVLLPFALYVTVVVGLGRLHGDHEMTAMATCGYGQRRVQRALTLLFAVIAVLVASLSIWGRPMAYDRTYRIQARAEASFDLADLKAGQFYQSPDGDRVLLVDELDSRGKVMKGVFLWIDRGDEDLVLTAGEARRADGGREGPHRMIFRDLQAYTLERKRGSVALSAQELVYDLAPEAIAPATYKRKAASTAQLLDSRQPRDIGELQWRLSRPLSALLLGFLASRIGRARPRRDRYGRLTMAAIIYIAYYQVSIVARTWVEQGTVGRFPGLWWVDALLGAMLLAGFPDPASGPVDAMRILDRYIARGIWRSSALVLIVLVALFSFGLLARELDDVGDGRYRLIDALVFVGLTAPQRAVELIPVSALLGTIIALGGMAAARELQAMRSVGVAVGRIALSALRAGIPLVLLVSVGAELLAPALEQQGRTRRQAALSRVPALAGGKGFWFRDGSHIARVEGVLHGREPQGVEIFEFDEQGVLRTFTRATSAELLDDETWMLADVEQQEITGQGSTTLHLDQLSWKTTLSASEMGLILQQPGSLSPSDLIHQVRSRRERGQGFAEYSLVLWQKLSLPLLTAAMILLAVPFVFGPLRSASMGRRVMLGSILGIGAWLLTRLAGYLGVLGDVQPPVTALAPVGIIALIALYLLRRIP